MDKCLARVRAIVMAERSKRDQPGRASRLRPRPHRPAALVIEKLAGSAAAARKSRRRSSSRCCASAVRAPLVELPLLVEADRLPRFARAVTAPSSTASAATSEPPMVTNGASPARRNGSSATTAWASRSVVAAGWATWIRPLVVAEIDVEPAAGPGEQRVPGLALPADQRVGAFGAVAEQVARPIFGELAGEGLGIGRDPVDRGIGEPGERHRAGLERLPGRVPFLGDRACQRFGRDRQLAPAPASAAACRRARFPSRRSVRDRGGLLPEALHLSRGRPAPNASLAAWARRPRRSPP